MRMVAEQRVVHHAESPTLASEAQRALELTHEASGTKRRDVAANSECEMAGMSPGERSAPRVLVASTRTGLAASAVASAAPSCGSSEVEGELFCSFRHGEHADTRS
jgi:hypothetical protein